ncbi:MAG: RAD55 family ATPase, partial [Halorientalis sp.]
MYELGSAFDDATMEAGTNVLVAGPPISGKRRLALRALAEGADRGEGSIVVTTRDNGERVLEDFEAVVGSPAEADLGIVDCVTKHQGQPVTNSEAVTYTSSPVDMTGIGIGFSEFIDEFREERGLERNRVMLDSISTL